jgi:hypothetical protein
LLIWILPYPIATICFARGRYRARRRAEHSLIGWRSIPVPHHVAIAIGSDAARTLTLAFALGISLDIVTKRASAVCITALQWLLSVTGVLYSRHTTGG